MSTQDDHSMAHDELKTKLCVEKCHALGLPSLANQVRVMWNPRMRSTAGRAWLNRQWIELNSKLSDMDDSVVMRILWHELAHLIAHHLHGKRIQPHGLEWQKACAVLGIQGERACHQLPLPKREIAKNLTYQCPKCQYQFQRCRPLKRKSACFHCCKKYNGGVYDERYHLHLINHFKK